MVPDDLTHSLCLGELHAPGVPCPQLLAQHYMPAECQHGAHPCQFKLALLSALLAALLPCLLRPYCVSAAATSTALLDVAVQPVLALCSLVEAVHALEKQETCCGEASDCEGEQDRSPEGVLRGDDAKHWVLVHKLKNGSYCSDGCEGGEEKVQTPRQVLLAILFL
eukprot:CAMPEP_0202901604 /NCGR_PEP_ID=MMETSP1392-20130828/14349_1 /ASSEMBLY_ACC=CAM_ASM_000868 /TAXON_ID=225041 /ORGANISM="Chlamydomonas chlamydogama, Strain SAG 11-48b" /LENGTH=165 /DNA_ID=CAMNT_0049588191 /DNA_START=661 /DNA_END=1158 /DNA_ORIENTATION=+